MKFVLLSLTSFFLLSSSASAYELFETEIEKPYDVVKVDGEANDAQVYLGELTGYPIMYEWSIVATTTLTLQLTQEYSRSEPLPFSVMVVRENDRGGGVAEVARITPKISDWQSEKDSVLGLTLMSTELFAALLGPGVYRVEVSTPINIGGYRISFGDIKPRDGYFESLSHTRATQKTFGYSVVKMLTSSLVYYPLGIIFILFAFYRLRKHIKNM